MHDKLAKNKLKQHNDEACTQLIVLWQQMVKGESLATPPSRYSMTLVTGVHVPEHLGYQKPLTLSMQDLGEQVSQVLLCWDVGNEGFSHRYSLTN